MQMDREEQVAPTVETPNRSALTPPDEAGDLGRKAMAASLKSKLFGRTTPFPRCGRFEVRRQVGMGGMGVVYEGWDPDLERKVALKVLHESASESGDQRKRLVREAQTLAKLRHPNVVQVYEVGAEGGRLFIAMEYVEGETLRAWLRKADRGWKEVLEKYVEAGRGLAAAHAEGLVHRDFKPDNVMVTTSGEVRVLDFGLAREEFDPEALSLAGNLRPDELTQTGALLGTPLYMAPEQFAGKPADARTDQFSFCVALWEGLYGERPFRGETIDELSERVTSGTMELPQRRDVPGWLRKTVLRGMSTDAGARWASMAQLVGALTPRRRSPLVLASGFLGVAGIGIAGAVALNQPEPPPVCADPVERLAGVWDDDVRSSVAKVVLSSTQADAPDRWQRAQRLLDAYANDWRSAVQESCTATEIQHTQPAETRRLRDACLDARLLDLEALTRGLLENPQFRELALPLARVLRKVDECEEPTTVEVWPALPGDPDERTRRLDVRRDVSFVAQLARFHATQNEPELREQYEALLQDLEPAVETSGEAMLEARFLVAQTAQAHSRDIAVDERAYWAAERAGDDRAAALSAANVAIGHAHEDPEGAARWSQLARAKLERVGTDTTVRAAVLNRLALAAPPEDREADAAAVQATEALGPDHPYAWSTFNNQAVRARDREAYAESERLAELCLEHAQRSYGRESGAAAQCLAQLLFTRHDWRGCEAIRETLEQPHSESTSLSLELQIGVSGGECGDARRLRAAYRRAVNAHDREWRVGDVRGIMAWYSLMLRDYDVTERAFKRRPPAEDARGAAYYAMVDVARGRIDMARKALTEPTNDPVANLWRSKLLRQLGDLPAAREAIERAVAHREPSTRPRYIDPELLTELGLVRAELRDWKGAHEALETASRQLEEIGGRSEEFVFGAELKFHLGRSIWELDRSRRDEARALVQRAIELYALLGDNFAPDRERAEKWLAEHGAPSSTP